MGYLILTDTEVGDARSGFVGVMSQREICGSAAMELIKDGEMYFESEFCSDAN